MTDLRETNCRCGVTVMESPRSTVDALCLECRQDDTGAVTVYDPIGEWHPTVDFRDASMIAAPRAESPEMPPPAKVSSRNPIPAGVSAPEPVLSLAADGYAREWRVTRQYSRGYAAKYRGAWQEEELWAVRFSRGSRGAFAVYRSIAGRNAWTWRDVWMWGSDLLPFGQAGVTELREWLECLGYVRLDWYREIIARRAAQEELRVERDRFRKDAFKIVDGAPARWAGIAWPGAFWGVFVDACALRSSVDGIYTEEELIKIFSRERKANAKEGVS